MADHGVRVRGVYPPSTLLRLRPTVAHGEGNDLCYMSQDFREGMDAILNKRKPVWKG